MDHVTGPLYILLAQKEGRIWFNVINLKFYELERIIWWCLYVLELVPEYAMQYVLKFVLLG